MSYYTRSPRPGKEKSAFKINESRIRLILTFEPSIDLDKNNKIFLSNGYGVFSSIKSLSLRF